jgi:hypothetical protein
MQNLSNFYLSSTGFLYLGILPLRIRRAEDSSDSSKPLPFLTHNWYHFSAPSPKSTRTDQNFRTLLVKKEERTGRNNLRFSAQIIAYARSATRTVVLSMQLGIKASKNQGF